MDIQNSKVYRITEGKGQHMKKKKIAILCLVLVCLLAGCSKEKGTADISTSTNKEESKILIAYFGRWGNTDFPDGIDASTSASVVIGKDDNLQGTTEYVASLIQERIGGDIHLIRTAEPYAADYDEVVDQNHQEQANSSMPELQSVVANMEQYDTIFIGYPIWATTIPRPVISFLEQYDLTGKTIIPFCTHGGYGSGSSYSEIRELCQNSEVLDGFEIEAEEINSMDEELAEWLDTLDIL